MKTATFSPTETKVLKILGRKKMTITEIAEAFYEDMIPMDPNNVIGLAIRRINRKCERAGLPWRLNGVGGGRAGKTVWKEQK